jgi:alcohol dehydrogenase class IV
MRFNFEECRGKFAGAYKYLCGCLSAAPPPVADWFSGTADDPEKSAESFIQAVLKLTELCKLPLRLRDLGVPNLSEEDLQELAEMALTDPAIMFNPRPASIEDLVEIIKGAY